MAKLLSEGQKQAFSHLALYVLTGIVTYTIIRFGLSEQPLTGAQVTVIALVGMLIVLELLTRVGWLTKPFPVGSSEGD